MTLSLQVAHIRLAVKVAATAFALFLMMVLFFQITTDSNQQARTGIKGLSQTIHQSISWRRLVSNQDTITEDQMVSKYQTHNPSEAENDVLTQTASQSEKGIPSANAKFQPKETASETVHDPFQSMSNVSVKYQSMDKASQTQHHPIQDMFRRSGHPPIHDNIMLGEASIEPEEDVPRGSDSREAKPLRLNINRSANTNRQPFARDQLVHLRPEKGLTPRPIQDIQYSIGGLNSDRAVLVVPRRAYYDNRLEADKPRNYVVIIAEVHKEAMSIILACELDGRLSVSLKVVKESNRWILFHRPKITHFAVAVQCTGLPQDAIFNGSIAKLIYRNQDDSYYSRVESEKPLLVHGADIDPSSPTMGQESIVVCATMFGCPHRLDQWLLYQEYLGVERVHLNADASFVKNIKLYPFLERSLGNGFVHMEIWNDIVGSRSFYHSQKLKYQNCLYRYIGVFQYGLFYDYDDFFNPLISDQKDIHYYFSKFFHDKKVGTVCLPWRQMNCGPVEKLVSDAPHGNLTSILTGYKSELRKEKKCAHQLNAPTMVMIHGVIGLLPNYTRVSINKLAYVAHNRESTETCT